MNKKELIERIMNVAENYKEGYIYLTDGFNEIEVLVDEYTDTIREKNENLLNALIALVDQIENEHCSEYIDDLQEKAKKAIEKAQGNLR